MVLLEQRWLLRWLLFDYLCLRFGLLVDWYGRFCRDVYLLRGILNFIFLYNLTLFLVDHLFLDRLLFSLNELQLCLCLFFNNTSIILVNNWLFFDKSDRFFSRRSHLCACLHQGDDVCLLLTVLLGWESGRFDHDLASDLRILSLFNFCLSANLTVILHLLRRTLHIRNHLLVHLIFFIHFRLFSIFLSIRRRGVRL